MDVDTLISGATLITMDETRRVITNATRRPSRSVMSACSNWVTCGIMAQLRARFAPEIFLMRDRSRRSTATAT